jgi:hypothetical protein
MSGLYTGPIADAYMTYLGRDPDPEGFDYWNSVLNSQGLEKAVAGISGSPEAQGIASPSQESTTEGESFDMGDWPTDLFPQSSSSSVQSAGLPDYANEWVKNWLTQYSPQITSGMANALTESENPIALNDAEKANLDYYANENLRPIISNLGAKGVLNSSTSQNAIAKVLADLGGTSYDKAMTNQQNKITNYQKAMALLESILGASRVSSGSSQSQSTNEWAPYGDLMTYIGMMSNTG